MALETQRSAPTNPVKSAAARTRLIGWMLPLVIASCVSLGTPEERRAQAGRLSRDLQQLSPAVTAAEADRLALTAIETSAALSRAFKPLRFPWVNNGLINLGLRQRGLCYQWRDDLFPHLHRLHLQTLELQLATSRQQTMREHNVIVVTAKGRRFEDGMVLDPWRQGGRLWWGRIAADRRHPWKPLPREWIPVVLRPLLPPR